MRENMNETTKKAILKFEELRDIQKLYFVSVIINHIENGLINDGNYSDEDEAYENEKLVFKMSDVFLENPMALATSLLLLGAKLDNMAISPNGIDIEPYIKNISSLKEILSQFYVLKFDEKIDFLARCFYDISEIKEVKENLNFDFNELIGNILNYFNEIQ